MAVAFSCAVIAVGPLSVAVGAPPAPDKTKALMEERVETLEELVAVTKARYEAGQALMDGYLSAVNDLLKAKMDLAPDRAARIALRREAVDDLKVVESLAMTRYENGVSPRADYLRARAARLGAEIGLVRE